MEKKQRSKYHKIVAVALDDDLLRKVRAQKEPSAFIRSAIQEMLNTPRGTLEIDAFKKLRARAYTSFWVDRETYEQLKRHKKRGSFIRAAIHGKLERERRH